VEGRGTAFVYQGEPRTLWLLRDVSERVAAEQAVQEERQRLARELHDSVSQALYSIALATKTAQALLAQDPTRVHEPLQFATAQAEQGLAEMRALIFALVPEALETEGLVAALEKHVVAVRARHGLTLTATLGTEPEAPLAVKEALYRIVQEALHNTVKHAQARTVAVRLETSAEALLLEVCDDGVGFATAERYPGHLGQHTMRDRAVRLGGTLEVVSAPGAGTRVRAQIPIAAHRRAQEHASVLPHA
jgi:signal transduction histidine kinase